MSDEPLKRVIESPAIALEKTIDTSRELTDRLTNNAPVKKVSKYWKMLGPGLTTGAADDDPAGITTYSQAGARYGYQLLWLSTLTFPLMAIVQEMCARIGLVTGRGLAANIRMYFPRWVLYTSTLLLFGANTLNLGADLGAMAKAGQLLNPSLNFGLLVLGFALVSLLLQIFTAYEKYASYLKWLALVLLSYVFTTLSIKNLDWSTIVQYTFIPYVNLSLDQVYLVCAVLGTTISPYLFFWQTSQEIEEEIQEGRTSLKLRQEETTNEEIKSMRVDVWSGMFLSNLVMYFIILACAVTLNANGITNITTASDAAQALRPLVGEGAYLLFTLGIIGTGMLAVPVLAGSASYALSESLGWKNGLYRKLKDAYAFYGVLIIAMLIGFGLNFVGIDPIQALIFSAVLNGLIAPVILVCILLISSDKKVMGNRVNGAITSSLGWFITIVMTVAGLLTIYSYFM